MPIYDYSCLQCGSFTVMRPMTEFRDTGDCPTCGAAAQRTILRAPAVTGGDSTERIGPSSNERDAGGQRATKLAHPAGCGCCVRRLPMPGALSAKGRVFESSGPLPRMGR